MLSYKIIDLYGKEIEVENVLTAVINSDCDVPADSLTICIPYEERHRGAFPTEDKASLVSTENAESRVSTNCADYVIAYDGDRLVFKGQLDEIINVKNGSAFITVLTARSLAGKLLDNEAEPVTYVNPDPEFIFERHAKPFGIECDGFDKIPFYGNLKIDKGMTHWQALKNFCENRYNCAPRITSSGKLLMKGYSDESAVSFGEGNVEYYSLKENIKRCELITEVMLKLESFGGYNARVENSNTDCNGLKRVRYVNALADTSSIATADLMIAKSNRDSYCLTLECFGCQLDLIGKRADVKDSAISKSGLRVKSVKYTLDENGEHSTVTLRKD